MGITSDRGQKLHTKIADSRDSMGNFGIGNRGVLRRHTNTTGNHDSSTEFLGSGGRYITGESSEKKDLRSSNLSSQDQKNSIFRSQSGTLSKMTYNRKGEIVNTAVFENNSDLDESQISSPNRNTNIILQQGMEIQRLNLILEQREHELEVFNDRDQSLVAMPVIQEVSHLMESFGLTGSKNYTSNSKLVNSPSKKTWSNSINRLSGFSGV